MGNKMCPASMGLCSCFAMQRKHFDDEDNETFLPRYKQSRSHVEVKRSQFTKQHSSSSSSAIFTIADKSLLLENAETNVSLVSPLNVTVQSTSSPLELDATRFKSFELGDALSIDSGMCYSSGSISSSSSDQDLTIVRDEVNTSRTRSNTTASDFNLFKKRDQFIFQRMWSMKDLSYLNKIKENVFLKAKECVSLTYLMFSNTYSNNNRSNQTNELHEMKTTNPVVPNSNNETTSNNVHNRSSIVQPNVDLKRINSLLLCSVTPLCQFFLRIYDTNFF